MSWQVLARKDVLDAIRDRSLYWNVSFMGLLSAAFGYLHVQTAPDGSLVADLAVLLTVVVPFLAVLVSHEAVAFERQTGRIRTTLALPHDRVDVVVGAVVGRAIVSMTAVVFALFVAVVVTVVMGGIVHIGALVGYGLATVALGAAFAGMAVGISAGTQSTTIAMVVGGLLVIGSFGWPAVLGFVWSTFLGGPQPSWLHVIGGWDPIRAYVKTAVLFSGMTVGSLGSDGSVVGPVLLVGWIVGVIGMGTVRFRAADL